MRRPLPGTWLRIALVGGSALLFLAAAKTHGRQIRLERQLAGYWDVSFGGAAPPAVEALWQRERMLLWSIGIGAAVLGLIYVLLARRLRWPVPPRATRRGEERPPAWSWWGALLVAIVWPAVIAFVACGLASQVRFVWAMSMSMSGAVASTPGDWITPALWGSAGWWALTAALLAAVAWLAATRTRAA
jgi:hypothetical protein